MGYEALVRTIFEQAGIAIGGDRPFDVRVNNPGFYHRFMRDGTLGLGESYVDGWWECERIDAMMAKLAGARLAAQFRRNPKVLWYKARAMLLNEGSREAARSGVSYHYDIGNDLYERMLDPRMIYTCAYWSHAKDLAEAQEHKLELVCRKLLLEPGMTVLDVGCGWGGFAQYAVERYGVNVVGVTISKEQLALATERCRGMPIELRLQDYRDVEGRFDRIVSMGMFEHTGYRNHRAYMEMIDRTLTPDGITLLHTMGRFDSQIRANDLFITRYVFPNTQVPSVAQIGTAIDSLLTLEDWESFGPDYDRTLMAWLERFEAAWPELRGRYDERFYRLWRYWLQIFAGWFRARLIQLWQIVMTRHGIVGGYRWQKERTPRDRLVGG